MNLTKFWALALLYFFSTNNSEADIDFSTITPSIVDIGIFQTLANIPRPELACLGLNLAQYAQSGAPSYSAATGIAKNLALGLSYGMGENVGSDIQNKIKKLEEYVTHINKPLVAALITTVCGAVIYLLQTNSIEENFAEEALQTSLTALATYNVKIITITLMQQIISLKSLIQKKHVIACSAGIATIAAACYYNMPNLWLPAMYSFGNSVLKTASLEFVTSKATNAYCWLQAYNYAKNKESISTKNDFEKNIEYKVEQSNSVLYKK